MQFKVTFYVSFFSAFVAARDDVDGDFSVKLASLPSAREDTRQRIRHRHLAP
jgi:hypothetical protein